MADYFIKFIWAGDGSWYPGKDNLLGFHNEMAAQRFANSDGFFLYEAGWNPKSKRVDGAKAIYAQGTVEDRTVVEETGASGWHIKINITKRITPESGVPLYKIKNILGMRKRSTIQRQGGILKMTEEQFKKLELEFNKCLK